MKLIFVTAERWERDKDMNQDGRVRGLTGKWQKS